MATGQDLLRLAVQRGTNPYMLGYALLTGASDPDEARQRDGGNDKFHQWNDGLWKEQGWNEGIVNPDACGIQPGAQARHLDLIAEKLGDKLDAAIAEPVS